GVLSLPNRFVFGLVAVSLLGSGCALVHDATHMTAYEMSESVEELCEVHRDRRWAEAAWERVRACPTGRCYSNDYADGFKDGFTHFLLRGGNGEPPPLPPRHY